MCDEDNCFSPVFRVFEEKFVLDFIESLRKKKGVSYAGIGRIVLDCDKSQASRLMRGELRLDFTRAIKLLRYFGYELLIGKLDIDADTALSQDIEANQEALEAEFDIMNNSKYREDKN